MTSVAQLKNNGRQNIGVYVIGGPASTTNAPSLIASLFFANSPTDQFCLQNIFVK
jgi:hypothetical protein